MAAPGALATSVVLHVGVIGLGAWFLHRSLSQPSAAIRPPQTIEVAVESGEVELPQLSAHGLAGAAELEAAPPEQPAVGPLGGERTPRPDLDDPGKGGSVEASERRCGGSRRLSSCAGRAG